METIVEQGSPPAPSSDAWRGNPEGRESQPRQGRPAAPARGFLGEAKALLRLGVPIMVTQACIMGMGGLDTLMTGRYGAVDLAGVALAGTLLWPVFMFMTGLTMAVMPIISQLVGDRRTGECGDIIRHGVWVAFFCSLVTILIVRYTAGPLLALRGADPAVAKVAVEYLQAVSWGMPGAMIYIVLRQSSEGLGHTVQPMIIAFLALVLNAPLNYLFIYGAFGLPELGGVGCGWATTLVMWFELVLVFFVVRRPFFRATGFLGGSWRLRWGTVRRILSLGVPIGGHIFLEMAVFAAVTFLIAGLSVSAQAGHAVASHISWAAYVVPMSLGSAAAIRVGFHVGGRDLAGARRVAATALHISLAYALLISICLIALRFPLAELYSTDASVVKIAANLLIFIALYQLFDDTNATMAGSLRGYKDTRAPMVISLVGYWLIALPLGVVLGSGWFGAPAIGVYGYWSGLTFGLFLVACCTGLLLYRTSHNQARIDRLAQA